MHITYIHHSGFLVETDSCYYLFDYEKGQLPPLDASKPIFVFSSHSHADHYNAEIFSILTEAGMQHIRAILSDDIAAPDVVDTLLVSPGKEYRLSPHQTVTTFSSTDLGVAFLVGDGQQLIYHAGDLNDWVWEEETTKYNAEMTENYHKQIRLLAETLNGQVIDAAFVVLDPRQEQDYHRGLSYFLEQIPVRQVYPMHYWNDPTVIDTFLRDHPQYRSIIQHTEKR